MSQHRVVVTGMGIVSPVGSTPEAFFANLINGKTGVTEITRFDPSGLPTRVAAEVKDFQAEDYIPRKEARRMDRFVQFAAAAARMALEDANLVITPDTAPSTGVWIGSGIGGIETFEANFRGLNERGCSGVNPFFIPMLIPNMAAGQVSIMTGARGPSGCTVTACATGTNSIGEAYRYIKSGQAKAMIAGGTEAAITPLGMAGFCANKAMTTHNDDPAGACRPFAADRDGFVMGEGAGIVVLEDYEAALKRGARIYAEVVGYGFASDAYHVVQPEPSGLGAAAAFRAALSEAGIVPEEVDYINAHGTGTPFNDAVETRVIKDVFGEHAYRLPVSSIKAATGHMLGAAGAAEFIATVLAMSRGIIPPTLNLNNRDPELDLNYVPGQAIECDIKVAMSDSLGFGGHNAVLVLRRV